MGKRGRGWLVLAAGTMALVMVGGCGRKIVIRDDAPAYENRGDQLYEKGEYELALKEYNRALELGGLKLKLYNNIGNLHFRKGQYELADKNYRLALGIDPEYIFAINNLALALHRQRRPTEAKNLILEALKRSPGNALLLTSLARIVKDEGDLARAVDHLKRAIDTNPDYAVALNNLGDIYLNHPELGEDPVPYIRRAIEKNPDNKLFYDTLGWYYTQAGVFDEAIIALGKAFVQEPDNLEVRIHYATVLEWIGKEKEALEQWKAIMEIPGDVALVNEARRHYWELKGR